jgi:hypothetical protein
LDEFQYLVIISLRYINSPIFLKFHDPIIEFNRVINYKFFLAMNLAFFNLISSVRAKLSSARMRVLLVCRPTILTETKIKNIKQELYINCFMLSFSR